MRQRAILASSAFAATLAFGAAAAPVQAAEPAEVVETYADIAHAMYEDSLDTAKVLQDRVDALLANPNPATLALARVAWRNARVPYQQTEVYRFGNVIVDEWEGKVNAWPLDEGLIDYVATDSYGDMSDANRFYTANVIANETLEMSGETIDASTIDADLIQNELHEVDGVEANVATGYHAVEFLLWGQDLNGTEPGAGNRPATDFDTENCTHGNCDRRGAYLKAATDLLISDLEWMTAQWAEGGEARAAVTDDPAAGLVAMVTGMGSLSYGELAGERMKLGLMLHDPEEEHDCFSDNTHYSHYYDVVGIRNVFQGRYVGPDGTVTEGPGLADLLPEAEREELAQAIDSTVARMTVLVDEAMAGRPYDVLLAPGNTEGNEKIDAAVTALLTQTKAIERAASALKLDGIGIEGSDSLDNPSAVLQ
ncbi:peptidase [Marivibrio halodurans]|uniref:Peptidase n=1 Tax=Marivibrio halodurans TaxID=2039722 RepID=A0A8J7S4G3_9PROT|nr:imelysin family protein [Marivibrio halodurans]MBP5856554.1 peptidase [Marivibrio halodurans]